MFFFNFPKKNDPKYPTLPYDTANQSIRLIFAKQAIFTPIIISNSRWQTRKELLNQFTNNGDIVKKANRP